MKRMELLRFDKFIPYSATVTNIVNVTLVLVVRTMFLNLHTNTCGSPNYQLIYGIDFFPMLVMNGKNQMDYKNIRS